MPSQDKKVLAKVSAGVTADFTPTLGVSSVKDLFDEFENTMKYHRKMDDVSQLEGSSTIDRVEV